MAQYVSSASSRVSSSSSTSEGQESFSITSPNRVHLVSVEDEGDEEYAGLAPDLYHMLKCESCSRFMVSEIHVCYSGHNICHDCKNKQSNMLCPVCNSDISPIMRNHEMETVASKVLVQCPCLGCPLVSFKKKIATHAEFCEHRVFVCPMQKYKYDEECGWTGNILDLLQHFEARHRNNMRVWQGMKISLRRFDPDAMMRDMHFFIYDDKFFLYHVRVSPTSGRISWIIQNVGPDKNAQEWGFEMQIFNTFDSERKVFFTDRCLPYSANAERSLDRGSCASVHLDNVHMFLNETGEFNFRFLLKCNGQGSVLD